MLYHERDQARARWEHKDKYASSRYKVAGGKVAKQRQINDLDRRYLAGMASRVTVVEMLPNLTATKILQERAFSNPKIEVKCGVRIEAIRGDGQVTAIDIVDVKTK